VPTTSLTAETALAHERLFPRVVALLKQVERAASRHPDQPVSAATRDAAQSIFAQARTILGREGARNAGSATADLSALSLGLGQLLAGLEAFEAKHSALDPKLGRVAWRVAGAPLPVSRLAPAAPPKTPPRPRDNGVEPGFRSKLYRRICERENLRYLQGWRDGKAGRPPIPPIKKLDVIPED